MPFQIITPPDVLVHQAAPADGPALSGEPHVARGTHRAALTLRPVGLSGAPLAVDGGRLAASAC